MEELPQTDPYQSLLHAVRDMRTAVQTAAAASARAAEAQRYATTAAVELRDTCRQVADEWAAIAERLRRPLRVVLAEAEEAARRARWHIDVVMPQSIRRLYCRRKSRLLRSIGQGKLANERLRELLQEIVVRFPGQDAAAADLRACLARTDAHLDEIFGHVPLLPFLRTAADGPDA